MSQAKLSGCPDRKTILISVVMECYRGDATRMSTVMKAQASTKAFNDDW
jgi:hypothetical protein